MRLQMLKALLGAQVDYGSLREQRHWWQEAPGIYISVNSRGHHLAPRPDPVSQPAVYSAETPQPNSQQGGNTVPLIRQVA